MEIKQILGHLRWFFLRDGLLYLLVLVAVLLCVDIPNEQRAINLRKINDLSAGVDMTQIYAFSTGKLKASSVNWKRLSDYFRLVLKIFPNQADAEMFLGYCEYYGLGDKEKALELFNSSSRDFPSYFWNLYDTGVILVANGDMQDAMPYFELILMLHVDRAFYTMFNSILYRQIFYGNLTAGEEIGNGFNQARERAVLFLTAANYSSKNYDLAELLAMKGISQPGIEDREPFYFYAGAVEMAKGKYDLALGMFNKAIEAKSKNSLVYYYASAILKKKQHLQEAKKLYLIGHSLQQDTPPEAFAYKNLLDLKLF